MAARNTILKNEVWHLQTDTVPALACRARDELAVRKIFKLKHRPLEKNLPVFCAMFNQVGRIAELNEDALNLALRVWPGAMTMILPKKVKWFLGDGPQDTIAVRIPDLNHLRDLCWWNGPLAQTSDNISGQGIHGIPSTIVEVINEVKIIREGQIPSENIYSALTNSV